MNLNDFKKLEESIKKQEFSKSYKNINNVTFYLSIFGNLASMFLAYFFLSDVVSTAIESKIIVLISTIILLGGLELLKREIFNKFSIQQLKFKSFLKKDVLPLTIVSLLLICASFYSSLNGAKEFSSKSDKIEEKTDGKIKRFSDSLTQKYDSTIYKINSEIDIYKKKVLEKDDEQTEIESNDQQTYKQRLRLQDLKKEKKELKSEIDVLKKEIDELESELDEKILNYKKKEEKKGLKDKEENKDNSYLFVIISTIIEFIILFGVYFNEYYKYRSYNEFLDKLDNDDNFKKWYNYNKVIDIIFTESTKLNDKVPSTKSIQQLCKLNGIIFLTKDITDMMKLFASLSIIRASGNVKYFNKSKENSKSSLKQHFNID